MLLKNKLVMQLHNRKISLFSRALITIFFTTSSLLTLQTFYISSIFAQINTGPLGIDLTRVEVGGYIEQIELRRNSIVILMLRNPNGEVLRLCRDKGGFKLNCAPDDPNCMNFMEQIYRLALAARLASRRVKLLAPNCNISKIKI